MLRWFGEPFDIIFAAVDQQQLVNPWQRSTQIVASLDYAKQDEVRERVWQQHWDMVIIDEAHKCSAYTKRSNSRGDEAEKTKRYPKKQAWGYKPGVAAVRVMSEALRGFSFSKRLDIGDPKDDFVFELRNGSRRALALWTAADQQREVVLPLPTGAGTLVSYEGVGVESGVKIPVQWPANALKLTLNNWPKYLLMDGEHACRAAP